LKIAIYGTRGIPNHHGGFEQFAEYFSRHLVEQGHEVYVYNSSLHPYQKSQWKGVNLIHKNDPENKLGTFGQFIYDLNCTIDTRRRNFDVIFQLGYTSSSVWNWLFPSKSKIITNMDGLEWKRSKYSSRVQNFLKYAEKLALKHSDVLVADSIGIQNYLNQTYGVESVYIAYGVETENKYDDNVLVDLKLTKENYDMLIARMEPENNVEVILDGVVKSNSQRKFVVVGNVNNKFGSYLVNKFKSSKNILFVGAIYDLSKLNSLRKNSNLYFHGHSVGGTNPSLLEAMASFTLICANDNIFNKSILKKQAYYFSNAKEVAFLLDNITKRENLKHVETSYNRVVEQFNWELINKKYQELL